MLGASRRRGERARGGGRRRRGKVLKAEQQGADLLPGALTSARCEPAPCELDSTIGPSEQSLLDDTLWGTSISPETFRTGELYGKRDLLPAGCAPRTLVPHPAPAPCKVSHDLREIPQRTCAHQQTRGQTDRRTDSTAQSGQTNKPTMPCVFPITGGGAEPLISPPL